MDTQKYEAFIKTAESGSMKKAADDLGYTQAGLSYIIRSLEEELETQLFHRDYGRIYLTGSGKELLPIAQSICNDQRRLLAKLSELKHLESGHVTAAVFTSIAVYWMPFLMKGFQASYPGIQVDVKWYDTKEELNEMLAVGDVDCGFSVLPDAADSFEKIFLIKDPMVVILPQDHHYAGATFFPSKAMLEVPYISSGDFSEMEDMFYANGVKPVPKMILNNDFAVMSMVSRGFGFSVFPAMMMEEPLFPLALLEPEVSFSREVGIVLRSWQEASDAAKAFISFTREWVSSGRRG